MDNIYFLSLIIVAISGAFSSVWGYVQDKISKKRVGRLKEKTLNILTRIYITSLIIAVVFGAISIVSGYFQYKINEKISDRTQENIAKANSKAAEANKRANELEKEVIESKRKYLEILERFSPRTIFKDKKQIFIDFLKNEEKGKIEIRCWNDAESYSFAQEIEQLLKESGYETTLEIIMIPGSFKGLAFGIKSESSAPSYTGVLQHAFQKIGFTIKAQIKSKLKDQQLFLYVGYKP